MFSSVSDVAVDVDPPATAAGEAAPLVQHAAVATLPPRRAELHLALVVVGSAGARVEDLEACPRQVRVEQQVSRPVRRVPGPREVVPRTHRERGVPRAHQLLGRERQALPVMQRLAAHGIRRATPAGAGALPISRLPCVTVLATLATAEGTAVRTVSPRPGTAERAAGGHAGTGRPGTEGAAHDRSPVAGTNEEGAPARASTTAARAGLSPIVRRHTAVTVRVGTGSTTGTGTTPAGSSPRPSRGTSATASPCATRAMWEANSAAKCSIRGARPMSWNILVSHWWQIDPGATLTQRSPASSAAETRSRP